MAGANDCHVSIALNLATILKQKLKGSPCRLFMSDMKVKVEQADAYFYPDVLVTCDSKDRDNALYKEYPVFIAEIPSPSGKRFTSNISVFRIMSRVVREQMQHLKPGRFAIIPQNSAHSTFS